MANTLAMELDEAKLGLYGGNHRPLAAGFLARAEPLGFAAGDTNIYRYVGNEPRSYAVVTLRP